MGIRKTDLDIAREMAAQEINENLRRNSPGSGISVEPGGRNGPYVVSMARLSGPDMRRVVDLLRGFVREGEPT